MARIGRGNYGLSSYLRGLSRIFSAERPPQSINPKVVNAAPSFPYAMTCKRIVRMGLDQPLRKFPGAREGTRVSVDRDPRDQSIAVVGVTFMGFIQYPDRTLELAY